MITHTFYMESIMLLSTVCICFILPCRRFIFHERHSAGRMQWALKNDGMSCAPKNTVFVYVMYFHFSMMWISWKTCQNWDEFSDPCLFLFTVFLKNIDVYNCMTCGLTWDLVWGLTVMTCNITWDEAKILYIWYAWNKIDDLLTALPVS